MVSYSKLDNLLSKIVNKLGENNNGVSVVNSFIKTTGMKKLNLPVVHGITSGTHPSAKYFPNKWNGYEYWMAYTPYPDVQKENPTIVASSNGYDWVSPGGLVNPISPAPETGYNSDTELVFDGTKMYCYWRWYTDTGNTNTLFRMESTNGVSWTNKQACVLETYADPLSPSIVVDSLGKYKMWIGASSGQKIKYYESDNGIDFTYKQDCETNMDNFGFHWHPYVWAGGTKYYCLSAFGNTKNPQTAVLMTDLYFGTSDDGLVWEFEQNPLVARGEEGLKQYRVYRSSAIRVGSHFKIYVSGLGSESEQIHALEAKLLK